ncbi:helix-turn-helix domain-containing protein [Euzebya sp.]|uniref:helix-turn-helix domain-containing protein n=1 Tax=Euzebya sp. TaxID=1971409 RepID=UPI003516F74E
MPHLGSRLRALRQAAALSGREAARVCGLDEKTFRRLESSPTPNPQLATLVAMQRAYGVGSIDELLGRSAVERLGEEWGKGETGSDAA